MNKSSRERLELTLNHKDPGKVLLDLGSTPITGIQADALNSLRKILNLPKKTIRINEPLQLLGEIDQDVRDALGIDVVDVTHNFTMFGFENKGWKPWKMQSGLEVEVPDRFITTVDENGNTLLYPQGDSTVNPSGKMPKQGYYFDNITRVSEPFDEDNADAKYDFKDDFGLYTDKHLRNIQERCDFLYNNTEYGLVGGGALAGVGDFATIPGPSVKHPKGVRSLEDFMVAHYTMPEYIKEMFGMQLEAGLKNAEMFYQAVGNKVQVMQISGTDFGTQRGPFMSIESYREFYKPIHEKINGWVHKNTNWKTFFHCCGAATSFLDDFCEAGVDILNPVQISAQGMDPVTLKERWGDKLVFWGGGIDTQNVLPFGTPEEVYSQATQMLEIFSKDGGYVFNAIHNIQGPTPAANLKALFDAFKDFNVKKQT